MEIQTLSSVEKKDQPAKEYSTPEFVEYGDIYKITMGEGVEGAEDTFPPGGWGGFPSAGK